MEHGICVVSKELTPWSASEYTVGVVKFAKKYDSPPNVQLTAFQKGRPGDWLALIVSVLEVTETELVIDFDGIRLVNGVPTFQQEVYEGAKCYWQVIDNSQI